MSSITVSVDGDDYTLDSIPTDQMDEYKRRCKMMWPDAGDDAWAADLTDHILGVTSETESTLNLTGIPNSNYNKIQKALSMAGENVHTMTSRLMLSANAGRFHIIKYDGADNMVNAGHSIVFLGYPDHLMEIATGRAKAEYERTVEECFASILLSFAHREVKNAAR